MAAHESLIRHSEIKTASNRSFGLVFAGFFLVLGVFPLLKRGEVIAWPFALSACFLSVALLVPGLLKPLNKFWTALGFLLEKIVSPVVMGVMFFGLITPIGLLLRLCGKDLLKLKRDPKAKTYWIEKRELMPPASSMKNQF